MVYDGRLGAPITYVDGLATTPVKQAGLVSGKRIPVTGSPKFLPSCCFPKLINGTFERDGKALVYPEIDYRNCVCDPNLHTDKPFPVPQLQTFVHIDIIPLLLSEQSDNP